MSPEKMKRVLLSSVCKPFGPEYGDGFGVSAEGTHQIMWAQGVFRVRATTTQWGLDFIAANLKAPTVTLHYPSMIEFVREIKKGYDYIGIAFISATLHKMIPMVKAIRKHAPESKIVLGGYGTALGKDRLSLYADCICQEEGVQFMRRLLGEDPKAPIVQPDISQKQTIFSIPMTGETGYVFGGLGCPNGCDFCATSHYFKRKHIKFLKSGDEILQAIIDLRRKHPDMTTFWINDEDFLLNEKRGREFLRAIRDSGLPPLSLSVFGSVKALSQYEPSELVEMGIDWIWIGYEGKRAGYAKQKGKSYEELFTSFRQHGISVLASMIIGFDYQTPEIIYEEFEELMRLQPTMSQFLIYGPSPGTPLQTRLEKEERLDLAVMADNRLHDGFTLGFQHPHIDREKMSRIQRDLYRQEFEKLGPSIFRVVDCMLNGYEQLREHPADRVWQKAEYYRQLCHRAMILLPASYSKAPKASVTWLHDLYDRLETATGPLSAIERVQAAFVPALIRLTEFKKNRDIGQQPSFTRRRYRWSSARPQSKLRPIADHA